MTPRELTLTASLAPAEPAPSTRYLTASASDRTIAGVIVEYGTEGLASTGPTVFEAGSLEFPAEPGRVKFLTQHDTERPLGVAASIEHDDARAAGVFRVAAGMAGDEALAMAGDGRRDGLSVGCIIRDYTYTDDGVLHVRAAEVTEVSLVTIPAFRSSLVTTVAASQKGSDMTNTLAKVAPYQLTASQPDPSPAKVEAAEPKTPAPPAAAPAPATPAPEKVEAGYQRPTAPQAEPVAPTAAASRLTVEAAAKRAGQYLAAHKPAAGLTAALTDVTPAVDAGEGIIRPQWLGELWQATTVARPTIDSIQRRPLNGLRVYGFRKVIGSDLINEYAFNKGAVPASGKVTTEPVEADAQGYAGGWDIDRRFIDLGDGSYIRAVFEAAADEYKAKTEASVVADLLAAATAVTGATTVTAALAALGVQAATLGSSISKIQFAPDVWATFVNTATADVPWWLQKQGTVNLGTVDGNAGGISFNVNVNLPAGTIEAHDSRAATWYEKGETPIEVQAVDIARGGVDLGVFGYGALIINDPRALLKVDLSGAPAAGGE